MDVRPTRRHFKRWVIPIGGGLLAAGLVVYGTPHVPWILRLVLALIAFAYIGGQSAAYLGSGTKSDEGQEPN
jgi:hypothetical protein